MTPEEIFGAWAPDESPWSAWAKPVLFAQIPIHERHEPFDPLAWADVDVTFAPPATRQGEVAASYREGRATGGEPGTAALVLDLPAARSVLTALALAAQGYRPVPLFNACIGPGALVDLSAAQQFLGRGAATLRRTTIAADAPPVMFVDAGRRDGSPLPGRFDNRSVLFPQDFPSAARLRAAGIEEVRVLRASGEPEEDLAHVLMGWRRGGLRLELHRLNERPLVPYEPVVGPTFGSLRRRVLASLGLIASSAGGFGGVVPMPQQGGG